jgi:hypothetical protein
MNSFFDFDIVIKMCDLSKLAAWKCLALISFHISLMWVGHGFFVEKGLVAFSCISLLQIHH